MSFFQHLGNYVLMLRSLFSTPENLRMYLKETSRQLYDIGIGSLSIIAIIATFVGAVAAVQFSYQLQDFGVIPMSIMGLIIRESMILELAPTISALLLAGKVGSNMATEIGTMRVSEQIDAMEIMGVNTKAYLIAPKLIAAVIAVPLLVIIAVALGMLGGLIAGVAGGFFTASEYQIGAQNNFDPYIVTVMIIKCVNFGFIITTIACYQGYFVKGGSLELGRASTSAVVYSSIAIIVSNFLIAFLLL